jgi:hypothetical protein
MINGRKIKISKTRIKTKWGTILENKCCGIKFNGFRYCLGKIWWKNSRENLENRKRYIGKDIVGISHIIYIVASHLGEEKEEIKVWEKERNL